MKITEHETMACQGSLHPHGHQREHEGPWSLRIGVKSQPSIVRGWRFDGALVAIEQTREDTNFTLIWVLFLKGGQRKPSFVPIVPFRKARWYRKSSEMIEVRLKRKWSSSFPHPLPIGKYNGSCMYDASGRFAVFTLQAMTLRKEPGPSEPKVIITPGDKEYGLTLRDAKRTLSRDDGVGG